MRIENTKDYDLYWQITNEIGNMFANVSGYDTSGEEVKGIVLDLVRLAYKNGYEVGEAIGSEKAMEMAKIAFEKSGRKYNGGY